ncbi:patatin-like phospholipase family protein [Bradyrhizobium sp. Ec3.3]|uniref:patatin-like phospholipase family protein n=1 Tax=Bradyrhizobium sp. Ec3.3 TaxID=189753 RepID=UPI00040C50CD|nr:patatin-like phospholipase family protein [Bradyrhizobium sp. Ec3.3]
MPNHQPLLRKTHITTERPPFERIALVLQGGGALGAYQGGVYQALAEANLHPDWVAGISIGAINSALIAGNPPEKRVERLREFWETVSTSPVGMPYFPEVKLEDEFAHRIVNQLRSFSILLFGAPGFFKLRQPPPYLYPSTSPAAMSYYDIAPLKATLERLVDFDLINAGATRFSVGTVNICNANFVYFDNATDRIGPEHVMASGSLPSGFPATEIEGEFYWDGGLVSNTPLQWVLDYNPRQDTLVFQLDLWSARGELPRNLTEVEMRQKEIRFSSRTRAATDQFKKLQMARRTAAKLLKKLPKDLLQSPEAERLAELADEKVYNLVQLIYHAKNYEGCSKDYEFSRRTMEEHWKAGYNDAVRTLRHPEVLQRPDGADGVFVFDLAEQDRAVAG